MQKDFENMYAESFLTSLENISHGLTLTKKITQALHENYSF